MCRVVVYARANSASPRHTQALTWLEYRNHNWSIARKKVMKLKEISYIHAAGHLATQVKQGSTALIDEKCGAWLLPRNAKPGSAIADFTIEPRKRKRPFSRYFRPFRSSCAPVTSLYSIILITYLTKSIK